MARLIGAQRMVLQAVLDLPKNAAGFVTDSQIATLTERLSCIRTHVHQVRPNTDGVTYCFVPF